MKKSYKKACVGSPPVGRTSERHSFVFAHRTKLSSVLICCLLLFTCAHYVFAALTLTAAIVMLN